MSRVIAVSIDHTEWVVSSKNLREFIKTDAKFDVVLVELIGAEAILGFGHYFNAPVIAVSTGPAYKWTIDLVATPNIASYVPNMFIGCTDRMNFWQRMLNSLSHLYENIAFSIKTMPVQQKYLEQIFPHVKNMPTVEELKRNVSLVLVNSHSTVGTARPYAPNMIDVGGLHIKKDLDPLPPNVQLFLDGGENGVIFLSLGSNVKFSKISNEKKSAFINAFKEHPNVRILIKNEEEVVIPSHKSQDVLVQSWISQQSVLAHRNVKVFVTHGGMLSTLEAVHFGKPIIGISFAFDQHLNMKAAAQKGYGIYLPFEQVTETSLKLAFREILTNKRFVG